MISISIFALRSLPETFVLDRHLLSGYSFKDVMTMIKLNISNFSVFEKFKNHLNWRHVCETMTMSEAMLEHFAFYLDWPAVSQYQALSEQFLHNHAHEVDWTLISNFQQLTPQIVTIYEELLILSAVFARRQRLWSEEDFIPYLNSHIPIWDTQDLSEEFITANPADNWYVLSCCQRRWSDEFLSKNLTKFLRPYLLRNAILTESQIIDIIKPVNEAYRWAISGYQVLSPEFINAHQDQLIWGRLATKQILTPAMIERIQQIEEPSGVVKEMFSAEVVDQTRIGLFPALCDWEILSKRKDLEESVIEAHKDKEVVQWDMINIPMPSDAFLSLFHDKLNANYVTKHASESFLSTRREYISVNLRHNKRIISMSFFHEYFDVFGAEHLATTRYLSTYFIDVNWHRLDHTLLVAHQRVNQDQIDRIEMEDI